MIIKHASCLCFREELEALFLEHWEEVAQNKELMQLAPDWERYDALGEAGKLFALFAFDDEARNLIGYSVNIIDNHLHYKRLTVASNDLLFVSKSARGAAGLKLMTATEKEAARLGAKLMLWHAKPGSSLAEVLTRKVERSKAAVQDIVYSIPV